VAGVIGAIAGLAVAGGPLAGGVLVQGLDWHWHPLDQRPGRAGAKAGLRPLHDALLGEIRALGAFDIAPKKGYLSLRRRKQFAMIQPSTTSRIDLGLILPATTPAAGRLEPAAKFNPLFTHRVRITAATDLDDELRGWLATAYALAG
jgi:hypothetical protein